MKDGGQLGRGHLDMGHLEWGCRGGGHLDEDCSGWR